MANRGETKTQKRYSANKTRDLLKKESVFTIKSRPGPHSAENSVPLGFVIRDLLKFADNVAETKYILHNSEVLVNGVRRKSHRFPVGLFDIVEFKQRKSKYRAVFDKKGKLRLVETKENKNEKLYKLVNKRHVRKGKRQLCFEDGTTLLDDKTKLNIGDSAVLEVPTKRLVGNYGLSKGNTVYITGGDRIGQTASIEEVIAGTITRPGLVRLKSDSEEFLTIDKYVFVVGDKKPVIELGE